MNGNGKLDLEDCDACGNNPCNCGDIHDPEQFDVDRLQETENMTEPGRILTGMDMINCLNGNNQFDLDDVDSDSECTNEIIVDSDDDFMKILKRLEKYRVFNND